MMTYCLTANSENSSVPIAVIDSVTLPDNTYQYYNRLVAWRFLKTAGLRSSANVLGGPWDLVTTYNLGYIPTFNPP